MTSTQNEQSTAALMHISQMVKYLFPFGGIIVPLIIWSSKRHQSKFLDDTGKSVLNFNISMILYFLIAIIILLVGAVVFGINYAIDVETHGEEYVPVGLITYVLIGVGILVFAWLIEFILTIIAALKASNGEVYEYPLSIKFLK